MVEFAGNDPMLLPPSKGDRYVVENPCPAAVFTMWQAPYTGGGEKTLPAGLRFVVAGMLPELVPTVSVDAEPYEEWEAILVDAWTLSQIEYRGYYLRISLEAVRQFCRRLP